MLNPCRWAVVQNHSSTTERSFQTVEPLEQARIYILACLRCFECGNTRIAATLPASRCLRSALTRACRPRRPSCPDSSPPMSGCACSVVYPRLIDRRRPRQRPSCRAPARHPCAKRFPRSGTGISRILSRPAAAALRAGISLRCLARSECRSGMDTPLSTAPTATCHSDEGGSEAISS